MNDAHAPADLADAPVIDRTAPQLTVRAVLTGMLIGALLSTCNIYSGLKIGWSFNMSIAAALVSYAFWESLHRVGVGRSWGLLENNINQTTASSAASIAGAGLVAPIPALTMLTGRALAWHWLALWTFAVSIVGVVVAIGLRRQLLIVDRLPFPAGVATAETLKEMYAKGREAAARVRMLLAGGAVAAALRLFSDHVTHIPRLALPGSLAVPKTSVLAAAGVKKITFANLGFSLDPSLMMVAIGVIIGMRAGASLLLGAIVAWGVVGPFALHAGWAHAGAHAPGAAWFGPMLEWLLWPGVAMMVTASLTSLAFSWRSIVSSLTGGRVKSAREPSGDAPAFPEERPGDQVPRWVFLVGLLVVLVLATAAQVGLFQIAAWTAAFGVLLTFLLAMVAGRVSGETGITPIGAMGKVTQLTFGLIAPADAAANLMAANVTGGAASQCADLLHDLKTGLLVGAAPRLQAVGQVFGVLAGALAGSAVYLILVPDPAKMLLTPEWPAPAVATWKAVAEVLMHGFASMPQGSVPAMVIAGSVGIVLSVLERKLPRDKARFIPSAASIGLAFVIPAWNSISMFLGALLALVLARRAPRFHARFILVLAAGAIAGESLAGVASAIAGILSH